MKSSHARDAYYIRKLRANSFDFSIEAWRLSKIEEFWEPYSFAYKNNPLTQIAFFKQSGVFDPSYIGFGLQVHSMVRFWNSPTFTTLRDKNFSGMLFPFVKTPINFIRNIHGVFVSDDNRILEQNEAVEYLLKIVKRNNLVIKPSLDSGSGASIFFVDAQTSKKRLCEIISFFKQNFVCQQVIKNHSSYAAPNATSLNTLRVATLIWGNEVYFVGAVFRMGVLGKVDNWDAGGIVSRVDRTGICQSVAVDGCGKIYHRHPNGFEFAGHKLYKADVIFDMALECHARIPQQKYLSWDFTVDDSGNICFIEMNSPGGSEVLQCVGINAYVNEDIAKQIYDEYLIKRFFYLKANKEWNYREFKNHISLVKYCGTERRVEVPRMINGKQVKFVYKDSFKDTFAVDIVQPESVQTLPWVA